jgi:hypothetical protein
MITISIAFFVMLIGLLLFWFGPAEPDRRAVVAKIMFGVGLLCTLLNMPAIQRLFEGH